MKIKISLIFLLWIGQYQAIDTQKRFTIMLNPAGDAKDAGRMLHNSFERGVTLQFAQQLKKNLELCYPNLRIILTRIPGETIEPLQNANFANRLNVNFYLSIHFYKEKDLIPKIFLYRYVNDVFSPKSLPDLFFYSFDNAHLINNQTTLNYAIKFKNIFESSLDKNKFNFVGLFAIPFAPLIGIKTPALAIEIGLKNNDDFSIFIKIIMEAIDKIINE